MGTVDVLFSAFLVAWGGCVSMKMMGPERSFRTRVNFESKLIGAFYGVPIAEFHAGRCLSEFSQYRAFVYSEYL